MKRLKILIANDIETRANEIEIYIKSISKESQIIKRFSYKDTLKEILIEKERYDFLILDITMPTFYNQEMFSPEAGSIRSLAGLNILERMKLENIYTKCILFTGLENFYDKYNHEISISSIKDEIKHYKFCIDVIKDTGERIEWQDIIKNHILKIKKDKNEY